MMTRKSLSAARRAALSILGLLAAPVRALARTLTLRPAQMRGILAVCILALMPLTCCWAAPTTAAQAQLAVQHWLALDPAPLGTALPQQIAAVTPYGPAAAPLYYAVALSPTGFVIVAGDDRLEPIVAFAPRGIYDPSTKNSAGYAGEP